MAVGILVVVVVGGDIVCTRLKLVKVLVSALNMSSITFDSTLALVVVGAAVVSAIVVVLAGVAVIIKLLKFDIITEMFFNVSSIVLCSFPSAESNAESIGLGLGSVAVIIVGVGVGEVVNGVCAVVKLLKSASMLFIVFKTSSLAPASSDSPIRAAAVEMVDGTDEVVRAIVDNIVEAVVGADVGAVKVGAEEVDGGTIVGPKLTNILEIVFKASSSVWRSFVSVVGAATATEDGVEDVGDSVGAPDKEVVGSVAGSVAGSVVGSALGDSIVVVVGSMVATVIGAEGFVARTDRDSQVESHFAF